MSGPKEGQASLLVLASMQTYYLPALARTSTTEDGSESSEIPARFVKLTLAHSSLAESTTTMEFDSKRMCPW